MEENVRIEGLLSDAEEGTNIGYRMPAFEVDEGSEEVSTGGTEKPEEEAQEGEVVSDTEGEQPGEDEGEEPTGEEGEEETYLVEEVPKELEEERKQLHRVYMGRLKELAGVRSKAALIDQINQDPERVLPELARRFGVQLGEQGGQEDKSTGAPKFEPKVNQQPGPDESMAAYIQRLISESISGLPEFIQQSITHATRGLQAPQQAGAQRPSGPITVSQDQVIQYLDANHSDWPMYEKEMVELVTKYPGYAANPADLYKQAKANHEAGKTASAKVAKKQQGKKGVARAKPRKATSARPKGRTTFDEAWDAAKKDLAGR